MGARNGELGYGYVTIALHWFTVFLVLAQFVVGYVMAANDDLDIFPVHQALGASILVVAINAFKGAVQAKFTKASSVLNNAGS